MIHLDAFGEGVGSLQHVDVIIRSAGLEDRLQNPVGVVPFLPRDMQRFRHDVDQQAGVILRTHDLDGQVFQRRFGQVCRRAQCIAECTASRV